MPMGPMDMLEREKLIREAESLEPLPASSTRLSQIYAQDDWDVEEIAATVELDEALTGRLLRLANSAAGETVHPVTTVNTAIVRMGPQAVLSLAMSSAMHGRLKGPIPAYGMDEGDLWRHSVASALAVEAFRSRGFAAPSGTFVAALVHDVGKLVIGRRLRGSDVTFEKGQADGSPWVEDETRKLGIDHAELGGCIAEAWLLPDGIPEVIACHHRAEDLPEGPLRTMADLITVADAVGHVVLRGGDLPDGAAFRRLGLAPEALAPVTEATRELFEAILELYD